MRLYLWDFPLHKYMKEYDAKIDSKKRLTIRHPKYQFYHVIEKEDGTILLEPRQLVDPNIISKETLNDIEQSIKNIKNGIVYGPIDINNKKAK